MNKSTVADTPTETAMVAVSETQGFVGLTMLNADRSLAEILRENVGEAGLTYQDFSTVKIPSGGGKIWEVTTAKGPEGFNTLSGIILVRQDHRTYYSKPMEDTPEGEPPDCMSPDSISGFGSPGGLCTRCPNTKWGSATRGRGQACSLRCQLLLLMYNERLPIALDLPPSSLSALRRYGIALTSQGKTLTEVETGIRLETVKNPTGVDYSRCIFELEAILDEETALLASAYATAIREVVTTHTVDDTVPIVPERTELSEPPAELSRPPVDAEDPFGDQ